MSGEKAAWEAFRKMMEHAQSGAGDGCVPVALVMLPTALDRPGEAEEAEVFVDFHGDARILWPASVPTEVRGPLFRSLANRYLRGMAPEKEG